VQYDAAILFEFENGTQILLSREENIAAYIEVNHKPEVIKEILNTMKLRKELTKFIEQRKEILENPNESEIRLKIKY